MADIIEKVNDGSGKVNQGYNKIETWDAKNIEELSTIYHRVLELIGEDPTREGLLRTPQRVAKSMRFLTNGYNMDAEEILKSAAAKFGLMGESFPDVKTAFECARNNAKQSDLIFIGGSTFVVAEIV